MLAASLAMRIATLVAVLTLAPGCLWAFDDGGSGDDECDVRAEFAAPLALRNPETLTCQSFGSTCDDACGPCPAADPSQPVPTWGTCGSACNELTESECSTDPECRVIKDVRCVIGEDCTTDFLGCFPTDQGIEPTLDCFAAEDGTTCSRSNACVAMHRAECSGGGAAIPPECLRTFALCAPEGVDPGRCHEVATCDRAAPACGTDETPGVANGCYTGACIPDDVCEPI